MSDGKKSNKQEPAKQISNAKIIAAIILVLIISSLIVLAGNQGSISTASGLPLFMLCASVGFILHWIVFVPSYIYQTEHYFDLTGSISYVATVTLAAVSHPQLDSRGLLLCIIIAVWAARLGSFLFLRVKKAGQDRRFIEIMPRFWRYLFTWTLGGAWVFITMAAGLAAITSMNQQAMGILAYVGLVVWVAGFAFEVIADRQKTSFRNNPGNSEKFITSGLWSRSRHPNYFGEIVLWIGVTLMALPVLAGWQFVTLISPVFVILLLTKLSGVPMLEKSGQKRWGSDESYQLYVKNTPVLIPSLSKPG